MQPSLTDYANRILDLMMSIKKKHREQFKLPEDHREITFPQLLLLYELYHHPNITLNELSKRLMLAKSTVSGIVDRLEAHGTIVKERVEGDKRAVSLRLSDRAMEKSEGICNAKSRNLSKRLKKLNEIQIRQIVDSLELLDYIYSDD